MKIIVIKLFFFFKINLWTNFKIKCKENGDF